MIGGARDVQNWYRYNTVLYVQRADLSALPQSLRDCLVPDDTPLRNLWPLPHRIQHKLQSLLPVAAMDRLSRLKAAFIARRAARARTG